MAQIIDIRSSFDNTVRIFDSFYAVNLVVNGNEYDIVFSYFKTVSATKAIAGNLTSALFRISQDSGIPALELMTQLQGVTLLQMNQIMAYYLNSFKSKSSLYGVGITPTPNQVIQRNIVQ
jgi:hypothetical protein